MQRIISEAPPIKNRDPISNATQKNHHQVKRGNKAKDNNHFLASAAAGAAGATGATGAAPSTGLSAGLSTTGRAALSS